MAQAATLKPGQIRHLLRVTEAVSRHPERDCLVLLLGLTCGMRVTEIAQVEIQDVLFASGAMREEISLRGDHEGLPPAVRLLHPQADTSLRLSDTCTTGSGAGCGYRMTRPAIEACATTASSY